MTKNRLIAGVALIVVLGLVGSIAAFVVDQEQHPETVTTFTIRGKVVVEAYRYDEETGDYVRFYYHESSNLIINIGKDWVELQLGSDSPTTDSAQWISLSSDTTPLDAAWVVIPAEINTGGGLDRADGAYLSTGVGVWTITNMFTADTTYNDVQLTGLQWGDIGVDNLLAANTFTAVTLNDGDNLTVTWTLTFS